MQCNVSCLPAVLEASSTGGLCMPPVPCQHDKGHDMPADCMSATLLLAVYGAQLLSDYPACCVN